MQYRYYEISEKQICRTMGGKQHSSCHFSVPTFIYLRHCDITIHCSFTDYNGIINSVTDAKYFYNGICQNPELIELTSVKLEAQDRYLRMSINIALNVLGMFYICFHIQRKVYAWNWAVVTQYSLKSCLSFLLINKMLKLQSLLFFSLLSFFLKLMKVSDNDAFCVKQLICRPL